MRVYDGVVNPADWPLPLFVVWLIMYAVIIFRAGGTYLLGRLARRGVSRIQRVERIMQSGRYQHAEQLLRRYGAAAVAVSFLLIGVQTVVNLAAGSIGMSLRRYLPALGLGGAVWALIYSTVGLVGLSAIVTAYRESPAVTLGLSAVFVAAIVGLTVGLRRAETGPDPADPDPED